VIGLDTNTLIYAINGRNTHVRARIEAALLTNTSIGIPAIVLYEISYGIRKSARPESNRATFNAFLSLGFDLWPFESSDAEEAGDIRANLEKVGTPIGPYDILIAAQSRRRGATLVSANVSEFVRVPGLRTEDWTKLQS
jgi:tRNA(fMet)-specific endonuclease VapC